MCDATQESRREIVVAVGIILHDGRVLIGKRPPHVRLPGLWEFPGGKIEPGESPAAGVVRELAEELGVAVEAVRPLAPVVHNDPDVTVHLHPFVCRLLEPPERVRACANEELRWVPADELGNFAFPPANASLLRQVQSLAT